MPFVKVVLEESREKTCEASGLVRKRLASWDNLSIHLCTAGSCWARKNAGEQLPTKTSNKLFISMLSQGSEVSFRGGLKKASYRTDMVAIPGVLSFSCLSVHSS